MNNPTPKRHRNRKVVLKRNLLAYALLLGPMLLFLFFVWVPLIQNFFLSFATDYSFTKWVGFDNYASVFGDEGFLTALKNTFVYILWSLLIGYLIPVFIGFLLSEAIHAQGFFRVCVYLPCMISGIATVFLFKNIYGDESYSILNVIARAFSQDDRLWASDPNLIIPLIVLAMTWRGAGGTSLIYLSSFQQIDPSIYEAARIDGASPLQRFLKLTIPEMRSILLTMLILQVIAVFQVFYEPLVIGNWGGPVNYASMTLMLLSYKEAFVDLAFGKAAAISVILSLIIFAFTALYFAFLHHLKKKEETA